MKISETKFTAGPWGIEQTRDMLWVGPMRPDGHKVDEVVVGLTIGSDLTVNAALKQRWNGTLIAAAPELYEALIALKQELWLTARHQWTMADFKRWAIIEQADAALQKADGKQRLSVEAGAA